MIIKDRYSEDGTHITWEAIIVDGRLHLILRFGSRVMYSSISRPKLDI